MEAAGETCKLCLKYIQGANLTVLDETLLGKLEFLQMDLDQSVEESNSVCKECEEKIENAFDFKSCLVNTESCLVPYVSEDKTQKVNLRVIVEKDSPSTSAGESSAEKEVCRLCKNFVDAIAVISLPKILKDDSMMEIFQGHIPEMDLEVTENPVVCESCQKSLASFSTLIASWSIANGWNEDDEMKEDFDFEMAQVKKEHDEFSDSNTNSSVGVDISDSAKTANTAKSKNGQTGVKIKTESGDLSDSSESTNPIKKFKSEENEEEEMEDLQLKNEEVDIKDEDGSINSLNHTNESDEDIFVCGLCNEEYKKLYTYKYHVCTAMGEELPYKYHVCTAIGEKLPSRRWKFCTDQRSVELPKSKGKCKIIKCQICEFSCYKSQDLLDHLSTQHCMDNNQRIYKCQHCEFGFPKALDYINHLTIAHGLSTDVLVRKKNGSSRPTKKIIQKCKHCSFSSSDKYKCLEHVSKYYQKRCVALR